MEGGVVVDLRPNVKKLRPHLVILGAGASCAALPNGDKNGNKLPVMNGFMDTIGISHLIKNIPLETKSNNFEDIYSELYTKPEFKEILDLLESTVYNYFSGLELPDYPTIYDYLVLSLREKDAIATFNWDPLLLQAYQRASRITKKLPKLIFLHGNVMVGICKEHKRAGLIFACCPVCGRKFDKVKLLYPIKEKNYEEDLFIKDQWNAVKYFLKNAFAVTIFGYGAPKSDASAISLFKEAWGNVEERILEEIEIIDIKDDEELRETWSDFIHTHHYKTYNSFFDSMLAKVPRRTIEYLYETLLMANFVDTHEVPQGNVSFRDLELFYNDLLKFENESN